MFRKLLLVGQPSISRPALIKTISNLVLLTVLGAASALACTTTWTNGDGNGAWSDANNWTGGIPTSSSDACVIDGTSTVLLSGLSSTGTLTLDSGNTVNMANFQLNVSGASISNAGSILNSDGILQLGAGNTTLSGGGSLTLSNGAWVNQASGGLTLTNQNNLIQGSGQIGVNGLSLDNQASGTVNANNSGATLFLNGAATSNEGLLTATNNGTLQISNNVANTGNITGNGGFVLINGTVTGGTLNSMAGGTIGTSSTATLSGVTISAGSNYNAAGFTSLVGTITNNGTITSPNAYLIVSGGDVTLQGGGKVELQTDAYIEQASGGLTLHNVDNTIEGAGIIGVNGLGLDNQASGVINATPNSGGSTLILDGSSVSNAGLLTATAGGTLQIDTNVTNTGANITANGGTVQISSQITGGTLNAINSGVIGTSGTATLSGLTISTGTNYNTGGTTNLIGTITNNGVLTSPNGFLVVSGGDVNLTGGGTVTLQTDAFIEQASGGLTLHNVNNTIQGAGEIGVNGLALDNQAAGIIDATPNNGGTTLTLNGSGVSNAGLLEATNGGTLQISTAVTNTGTGSITANNGSVQISSTINGGPLSAINGGTIGTNGTATLNGVTITTGTNYNTGAFTYLDGTITNNGALTSPNGFIVVNAGDVTLQGGGTVNLQTDAYIEQASGGLTLHNVDNTIQGAGEIGVNGLTLDNQASGIIDANSNVSGQQLILNGPTVTNAGLLEATNGGTLQISTIVNNSSNITGNGGNVLISGTINGGTLNALNGGTMGTNGTAVLNGVTISAGTTYGGGVSTFLQGTITNHGNITSNNEFLFVYNGDVNLQGGGTVSLTGNAFLEQASGGLTLHNVDNTIQGTGTLGVDGLAIDNQAAGVIKANVSGGTLLISGSSLVTNAGTFEADAGATLHVASALNSSTYNAGTLETGTYHVISTLASPGTIQLDALGNTGGEIRSSSANIILDGPNANPIVDQANMNALSQFQDNLAGGNFTVENGQNFSTAPANGQDFQNEGSVTIADGASSFTTSGNYTQDGVNAVTKVNGTLTADGGNVNINDGLLWGVGTVQANVNIGANGTLSPGDPPGPIHINGNLTINGTLDELVGGAPGSGIFGQTIVSGSAAISNGTLDISLVNGFTVAANTTDKFIILTAGSPIGQQFATVDFLNAGNDVLKVDYSVPNEVILDISGPTSGGGGGTATPEPAEFLPLIGILGALALWKVRRKRATTTE